jgi:hypothetical protein
LSRECLLAALIHLALLSILSPSVLCDRLTIVPDAVPACRVQCAVDTWSHEGVFERLSDGHYRQQASCSTCARHPDVVPVSPPQTEVRLPHTDCRSAACCHGVVTLSGPLCCMQTDTAVAVEPSYACKAAGARWCCGAPSPTWQCKSLHCRCVCVFPFPRLCNHPNISPSVLSLPPLCSVQAVMRGKRARRRYRGMLARRNRKAVDIQAAFRGHKDRAVFLQYRTAVCKLQSAYRGQKVREEVHGMLIAAIDIQRIVRGKLARKLLARMRRRRAMGCTILQAFARMCVARARFLRLRGAMTQLQSRVRRYLARQLLALRKQMVLVLQSRMRQV